MAIQFPAKADFVIGEGVNLPVLEATLVGADGKAIPLYGSGATVKFYMMPENSAEGTTPTVNGVTSTILADLVFTAGATTDTFTSTAHGLVAGSPVMVKTSSALPTGLSAYIPYYILAPTLTADTFQLSSVPNGTAVNVTGNGTGTQTLVRGRVKHTWTTTHTATPGKFWGYFIVTFADTTTLAVPSDDQHPYIFIRIAQKIG